MATGIAPDQLDLDEWWLEALTDALGRRWGPLEELAAVQAELLHALLIAFVQVNSKQGTQLPKPLRIPRPNEKAPEPSTTVEIFAFFGRR